jgi:hypothetical protein
MIAVSMGYEIGIGLERRLGGAAGVYGEYVGVEG